MIPKMVLAFFGLSFAVFGGWALAAPDSLAGLAGLTLQSPAGRTEFRTFYGGLEIALAVALLAGALATQLRRPALLLLVVVSAGLAAGRIIGLLLDHSYNTTMAASLGWELGGVVLGLLALRLMAKAHSQG